MITIISPTTTMNFGKNVNVNLSSDPIFLNEANYLMSLLKKLSPYEVGKLMNLGNDLSILNFNRYSDFNTINNPRLQSIFAFDGEVFSCMNVDNFNIDDFKFANDHLRIISGLYGVLHPLDYIQPYRLEMKSKLKNESGNDLYKFWKNKITSNIISDLNNHKEKILVNLASSEYIKSIDLKEVKKSFKFIDIVFKEYIHSTDTYKVKGLYAKKARGYMAEYIIKNKIDNIEDLKLFNKGGYLLNIELSTDDVLTFTR